MSADLRGAPESEKKLLYQEQNALGLDQGNAIYRIFQLPYLLADIKRHYLTHVRPSPDLWNDPYENPLLKKVFEGDNPGERISLRGIIEKSMDFWDGMENGVRAYY
jgi:hypothetical protein